MLRISALFRQIFGQAQRRPALSLELLTQSVVPFIVLAMDDARCLDISRDFANRLGYAREEVLGHSLMELEVVAGRRTWTRLYRRMANNRGGKATLAVKNRLGSRLILRISAQAISTAQAPVLLAIVTDVTAERELVKSLRREKDLRSRLECALGESERRRAEAEQLAVAGQVAAQLVHEINNPLAGIKNALQLVQRAIPPEHPRFRYLEMVDREIQRIVAIVRQTYNLYRAQPSAACHFSLAACLEELLLLCEPAIRTRQLRVHVEITPPDARVYLPEGYVRQILYNLLTNAIQASPPEGAIKITLALTEEILRLAVHDQGGGVPKELRSRIFEPFFRARTPGQSDGLGLGLAICKRLAETLGGSIDVHSELGKGSVFHAVLPIATPEPGRSQP